jgi:hypothetical protein
MGQTFQGVMRRLLSVGRMLALVGTLACAEWRVEMVPPAGSRAASRLPSRIRIQTQGGQSIIIWDPKIRDDTLIGFTADGARRMRSAPVRVAVVDVQQFEALRARPATSAALTLGLLVGAIVGVDVLLRRAGL